MRNIGTIFSTASGAFGLIPGIAVLITEVGVPPNTSKILYATTIESLGVLCLMILWVNHEKIKRLKVKSITRATITLSIGFFVSFLIYLLLFGLYVVDYSNSEALLFPFWPTGELKEGLHSYGSKAILIKEWGRDDVFTVIQESSLYSLQWTKIIFLVVYVTMFLCLTVSFALLGNNLKGREEENT